MVCAWMLMFLSLSTNIMNQFVLASPRYAPSSQLRGQDDTKEWLRSHSAGGLQDTASSSPFSPGSSITSPSGTRFNFSQLGKWLWHLKSTITKMKMTAAQPVYWPLGLLVFKWNPWDNADTGVVTFFPKLHLLVTSVWRQHMSAYKKKQSLRGLVVPQQANTIICL